MKKYYLLPLIMVICIIINAQTCIERAEQAGFKHFIISDNVYHVDSIEFLISHPINPENPNIVFLQGSGNLPLISYDIEQNFSFATVPPYDISTYVKKYNFICISKPSTPLCTEWKENRPTYDTTRSNYLNFLKMDFLDYYVAQTNQVIDFVKNILRIETPIYLMGTSQGGKVVAKYSFLYPDKVQKLVILSSGIFDRHIQDIYEWRLEADQGKVPIEKAFEQINRVYERYKRLKNWGEDVNNWVEDVKSQGENVEFSAKEYTAINNYSYDFDIPIDYLLKINIPILDVYGTSDYKTRDNDMLPFFFIRAGKNNLTMMPIFHCNHVYVKNIIDSKTGEVIESKYMGDEVFTEIEKWLTNGQ